MDFLASVIDQGFTILENVIPETQCAHLRDLAQTALGVKATAGDRNVLRERWVRELADSEVVRALVNDILVEPSLPVRAILFDKSPGANWNLGYHQDRGVAFAKRVDAPGYVGWSVKDGVPHAIAPAELLVRMITIRISLDPCGPENGPLRVLPGTHKLGLIPKEDIVTIREGIDEVHCTTGVGGVVIMRPLLLHASSAATVPSHRRVLHLEYGPVEPGHGLLYYDWAKSP